MSLICDVFFLIRGTVCWHFTFDWHWAWYPDRVKKRLKKPVLNKILGCKSATDKFCIVDKNLDNY
jgi:hypothetical protein